MGASQSQAVLGFKFRRQHPIGPYFADLCCVRKHLVVELDGGQHGEDHQADKDAARTAYLSQRGYRVIRVWNNEVTSQMEGVLDRIYAALTEY
jgi:very-short-patch-repair endonuclease